MYLCERSSFDLVLSQAGLGFVVLPRFPGLQDVDQVRQLKDEDKGRRHEHEDGAPSPLVGHQGGQPALKLVSDCRHREQEGGE